MHDEGERIAVLETKVEAIHASMERIEEKLNPMIALYQIGKFVVWIVGGLMSFSHWDQIVAFINQMTAPPKH